MGVGSREEGGDCALFPENFQIFSLKMTFSDALRCTVFKVNVPATKGSQTSLSLRRGLYLYLYLYLHGGRLLKPSSAEAVISFGPMRNPEITGRLHKSL